MFFAVVLSIWALLHVYVGGRLAGVPWIAAHIGPRLLFTSLTLLWLSFPIARLLAARGLHVVAQPLELVGSTWIGVLFLLFTMLLAADALTLGGWLLPRQAPQLRGWVGLVALALAAFASYQGNRAPVVQDHEVVLPGLPPERDGLTLVMLSDLHLGTLNGEPRLSSLIAQVAALHPDAVVIAGDLVDSDLDSATTSQPALQRLRAPLGVWGVLGNHDVYAGAGRVVSFAEATGVRILRNQTVELAPGLQLAGIDDPANLRGTGGDHRLTTALASRGVGAAILLSHTPDQGSAEAAAAAGIGLMLSGHTHGGQLWPFGELVRRRYPLFTGRYKVGGLTVLVGRGTGTWGPRMRLWQPGEILRIRLRTTPAPGAPGAT